jgi:hypothetical protein
MMAMIIMTMIKRRRVTEDGDDRNNFSYWFWPTYILFHARVVKLTYSRNMPTNLAWIGL